MCDEHVDFFFFFVKQKTAYEILGRDWSSDVCSSDLMKIECFAISIMNNDGKTFYFHNTDVIHVRHIAGKIGRASCRERV